jgi:hypothetical protein
MRTAIPQLGKRVANLPQLRPLPRRKDVEPSKSMTEASYARAKASTEYDIGPGPWYWHGIKASRPEYLCLLALTKMGWKPEFQVTFAGGRQLRGGQVIDILLRNGSQTTVIDVISYYHYGAAKAFNDQLRQAEIQQAFPGVKYLTVDERYIDQGHWLDNFLELNVGRY